MKSFLYRVTTTKLNDDQEELVDLIELESSLDLKAGKSAFDLLEGYRIEQKAESLLDAVEERLGGRGCLTLNEVAIFTAQFNDGIRDAVAIAAKVRPNISTAQANWLEALKAFESAALKLEEAWGNLEFVGGEAPIGYPFNETFDEVCDDIRIYRQSAQAQFATPPLGGAA